MLKTRIITALVLVAALGLVLFALPPLAARLAFAAIAALAAWEWAGLMKQDMPARYMFGGAILVCCWQLTVTLPQLMPVLLGPGHGVLVAGRAVLVPLQMDPGRQ